MTDAWTPEDQAALEQLILKQNAANRSRNETFGKVYQLIGPDPWEGGWDEDVFASNVDEIIELLTPYSSKGKQP